MRRLVAQRANYICEACLAGPVDHIHHTTYEMGKLPPAWRLRGVCKRCHDSLHDLENEWGIW